MAASKVTFNNAGDLVLVQCTDKDVVGFISDLKENLDEFKLLSYDTNSTIGTVTFTCKAINHSTDTKTEYNTTFQVRIDYKVLIKNRRIVSTDITALVTNNLIDLK